jgi:hypothetical protein
MLALFLRRGVDRLAVFYRAASFAFTGVFPGASVVTGFAAAFAFAGVLALAIMGLAFLFVSEDAGGNAGLVDLCHGRGIGDLTAADDAGESRSGEERFGSGVTYHGPVFLFGFACFLTASQSETFGEARSRNCDLGEKIGVPAIQATGEVGAFYRRALR